MLRSERVTLRPIERDDVPTLHRLRQHVDLYLLANERWNPTSLAKMERDFEKRLEEEESSWFVVEADGRVLGTAGLHSINRVAGTAAVGITLLDRERIGKGYGREAVRLLLEWGFRMQGLRRIWLEALASNTRAVRAYEACGFAREGLLRAHDFYDGGYHDVVLMGLLRDEWQARRDAATR